MPRCVQARFGHERQGGHVAQFRGRGLDALESGFLTLLYQFCGIAGFFGYIPQVRRLWRDTSRAESTSLTTWGWWVFVGTVGFIYALIINKDPSFILMATSNFLGGWMIFGLALWRRIR